MGGFAGKVTRTAIRTHDGVQMQLGAFNAMPDSDARSVLEPCLGVSRWVDEVVCARPYAGLAALTAQATASARHLTDQELKSALSRHPRLGEAVAPTEAPYSAHEQAGLGVSDHDAARRLATDNRRYEERFGQVFLIRAAGRSAAEVSTELERRLGNDEASERREVVRELREIALRRLQQVVQP